MKNPHAESTLLNRTITQLFVSKDRTQLRFMLEEDGDTGEAVVKTDADCCSYTWIEGVELCSLPAKVLAVEDIEMPESSPAGGKNGPEHPEVVSFYGLKITTDKGHIVIDFRNDSNGYYGGSLCWPGERHYGGVYGQQKPGTVEWVEVTP